MVCLHCTALRPIKREIKLGSIEFYGGVHFSFRFPLGSVLNFVHICGRPSRSLCLSGKMNPSQRSFKEYIEIEKCNLCVCARV